MMKTPVGAFRFGCYTARMILLLFVFPSSAGAQSSWPQVTRETAAATAAEHLTLVARQALGRLTLVTLDTHCYPARGPSWRVSFDLLDGAEAGASVDAVSGDVWTWFVVPGRHSFTDAGPSPRVPTEDARIRAWEFVEAAYPALRRVRLRPGSEPLVSQYTYIVGWDVVLDPLTACLGPTPLIVDVDHQTGDVLGVELPYVAPIWVDTRPAIPPTQIAERARRHAMLNPNQYPIARVDLRVLVDGWGAQRLVYECFQYPLQTENPMYGVVFDAHTGEPLYPIAPIGGGKYPARSVRLPRHASVMLEPGRRALSTQLCPPVLGRDGLWLRAEHLRAVDGVEVDVTREGVTVHHSGRTIGGTDLGARWRDYGWWVPLRKVAKALGWRVDWNNAKKEAVIRTGR
ncbi:MAG: hypothetical protein GX446_10795 [Chthonomonadales bacterium]|nr:hypothetical protein [Chthonomonadales bacterium]